MQRACDWSSEISLVVAHAHICKPWTYPSSSSEQVFFHVNLHAWKTTVNALMGSFPSINVSCLDRTFLYIKELFHVFNFPFFGLASCPFFERLLYRFLYKLASFVRLIYFI